MPIVIRINQNIHGPDEHSQFIEILNSDDIVMPDGNYPRCEHVLLTSLCCTIDENGNIIDVEHTKDISQYIYHYIDYACDGTPIHYVAQPFYDDRRIIARYCGHVNGFEFELSTLDEYYDAIRENIQIMEGYCCDDTRDINKAIKQCTRTSTSVFNLNEYNVFDTSVTFTHDATCTEGILIINKT